DKLRREALSHLERAEKFGVPSADEAALHYRLGKACFQSGGEPARVISYLAHSVAEANEDPAEGYRMLAQAYLRLPQPNLEAALNANMTLFALPIDDEKPLGPARLTCGEILFRQKNWSEAVKMLGTIGADAPRPILQRARYLQARCCQELSLWDQAIPLW